MRKLSILLPHEVEHYRSELRDMLAPAFEHANGEYAVDDVFEMVRHSQAVVGAVVEDNMVKMAFAAKLIEQPGKTIFFVMGLGGRGFEHIVGELWDDLARVAKIVGADVVQGAVRPSMQRLCRRVNAKAKAVYTVMEREL